MLTTLLAAVLLAQATPPPKAPAKAEEKAALPAPVPPAPTTTAPPAQPAQPVAPAAPTPSSCMMVGCTKSLKDGSTERSGICPKGDVPRMLTFGFDSQSASPIIACLCCPKVSTAPRVSEMEEAKP